jgi:hypothetical protein
MSTSTTGGPTEYSLAEISGAISRVTGLAPAELSDLSGQLYSDLRTNPSLRMAGLDSAAVMAYVATHLRGDIAEKMDPAKREALLREQARNANPTSAAAHAGSLVFINGQWVSAGSSGGARAGGSEGGTAASRTDVSADVRGISQANYHGTVFDQSGLGYGAFDAMRKEGFNGKQIIAAVDTNKGLGLGANDNPAATARLQRDVPSAVPGLFTTRDNWKSVFELERAERDARERGDTATAAQMKSQIGQARQHAEEHDKKEQERVHDAKPERVPDLIDRQQHIKQAAKAHVAGLTPGDESQVKVTLNTIDRYRRNPDDALARRDYQALKKATARDPKERKAMAALEKELAKDAKMKRNERANNGVKAAQNDGESYKGDAGLDFLNDGNGAPPVQTAPADVEGKPSNRAVTKAADAQHDTKSDARTSTAPEKTADPDKKKVAQVKPAAPAA